MCTFINELDLKSLCVYLQRMDEAFSTAARCQADLQIQRRKNALQEKQLMCHHGGILKSKNNENNVNDLESE